jgi:hypothetical protein
VYKLRLERAKYRIDGGDCGRLGRNIFYPLGRKMMK